MSGKSIMNIFEFIVKYTARRGWAFGQLDNHAERSTQPISHELNRFATDGVFIVDARIESSFGCTKQTTEIIVNVYMKCVCH